MWLLDVLVLELIRGIPQVETSTPIPLLLLGAGLINVLSSIPMVDTRRYRVSPRATFKRAHENSSVPAELGLNTELDGTFRWVRFHDLPSLQIISRDSLIR